MRQSSDYNGIYADIFEVFGEEMTQKFHHHFKGHQMCCPMKLHSKEYTRNYIQRHYNGKNIRQMAQHLGYSERWMKQLLANETK